MTRTGTASCKQQRMILSFCQKFHLLLLVKAATATAPQCGEAGSCSVEASIHYGMLLVAGLSHDQHECESIFTSMSALGKHDCAA